MTIEQLAEICDHSGLSLSSSQLDQLSRYEELLRQTNQVVNLISRKDEENILEKHILHSLTVAMPSVVGFEFAKNERIFDIGSGGGLPGIPVKIARPDLSITLCDSIAKKMTAVQNMIAGLSLSGITSVTSRAEELATKAEHRKKYDRIISRAVAPLDELVQWTTDLLKPGGMLLSLKGGDLSEEIGRTKRFKTVASVTEYPLSLIGYDGFLTDDKKAVCVIFKA
ncbi:MAG TPA: 16S rRNA (guanine(527)-N(7))-methyltransferase RsmG [Candidatus Kapabacteria bacterium]|nr:16S rRNA (guanine(527)-N(7))-methyltransferase RsmG [Candidatus Kapabacteria bacterium]